MIKDYGLTIHLFYINTSLLFPPQKSNAAFVFSFSLSTILKESIIQPNLYSSQPIRLQIFCMLVMIVYIYIYIYVNILTHIVPIHWKFYTNMKHKNSINQVCFSRKPQLTINNERNYFSLPEHQLVENLILAFNF